VPLHSASGQIIGIAGIARDITKASLTLKPYAEMSKVIEYIDEHYCENIEISDLAHLANLSVSQFERNFKKIFQISPIKHIVNVRIKAASELLTTTNKTIAAIAQETGFYDHSHLTRKFTAAMKMSPSKFRREHGK
jgi:transcriptional regulator GlxA family with amidase domain